jgi:NADH-quinone oxidoreductase subunit C
VTAPFDIAHAGSANKGADVPASPRNVPNRGGAANPSAAELKAEFGAAIRRVDVVWGETNVYVAPEAVLDIIRWLHDDPSQQYDYLVDVTAVEYRDLEQPIEVVWHLRSLPYRRFL